MESEKVKYLIDMINDMDLINKLRLAICMSNSNCTNLKYDKPEMYKYFDNLLKEIDEEYKEYVNNLINKAEKSIKKGRVRPIECIIKEIEEEYGLMPR